LKARTDDSSFGKKECGEKNRKDATFKGKGFEVRKKGGEKPLRRCGRATTGSNENGQRHETSTKKRRKKKVKVEDNYPLW